MKRHDLKIAPKYFMDVVNRVKTFEIRNNDREFKVGDVLFLHEYVDGDYTKEEVCKRTVTYITDYAQKDGYVVMSIE